MTPHVPMHCSDYTITRSCEIQQSEKELSVTLADNLFVNLIRLVISATNDQLLVQLFGRWSSCSWEAVTKLKDGRSCSSTTTLAFVWKCSPVQYYQVLEGGCC